MIIPSRRPSLFLTHWLKQRWLAAGFLFSTAFTLFLVTTRASLENTWLQRYAISLPIIQQIYLFILGLGVLLLAFEPQVRRHLYNHPRPYLMVAGGVSVWIVSHIGMTQIARTFEFPLSLWVMIVHGVGLCALVAAAARQNSLQRTALVLLIGISLVLFILHTLSINEFMRLDIPDEPLVASMAVNYALNDQLSPSFIASPYGTPDPSLGRYFMLMGLWLKLVNSTSVAAMRAFPLLVGLASLLIFVVMLRRIPDLTTVQRAAGVAIFLALSAFVRASHNLRMDAGLVVYGAVALAGLLMFDRYRQKRWLVLAGFGFWIGLESVPTVALLLATSIGLVLLIRHRRQPAVWLIYAVTCALSLVLFFVGQFLPDLADGYARYQLFTRFYTENAALAPPTNGLIGVLERAGQVLFTYLLRFNLALSPLEIVFIVGAIVALWLTERWLFVIVALTSLLSLTVISSTYQYWVLLVPFIAYGVARLWRFKWIMFAGSFVGIPALAAAPIYDLLVAIQTQPNTIQIVDAEKVTPLIPENVTVVGEGLFWFTLHRNHNYIHWSGINRIQLAGGGRWNDILANLDPEIAICWVKNNFCDRIRNTNLFAPEGIEVIVDNEPYLVFYRLSTNHKSR